MVDLDARQLGERIAAARARADMTQSQLASVTGVDRSAIAKIENGMRRVGALELAAFAAALDERIEWFVDDAPEAIVSHRNLQQPGAPSPKIDRLIDRAARNVEFVQEWGALSVAELPAWPMPTSLAEAEDAARSARRALGVDRDEPLREIARSVESVGLLVFSYDLGADTADAGSVLLASGGLGLINGHLQVGRRRLAVAHELGHCLFADEYTVDWRVAEQSDEGEREARVDRFARALLLPAEGITSAWSDARGGGDDVRTAAVRLASRFRVDMSTLARRLGELRLVGSAEEAEVRAARTTRADIVELDLVVAYELEAPALPRIYEEAVLRLFRNDDISAARAIDLLFDTWSEADLPPPPRLPERAIWKFVS